MENTDKIPDGTVELLDLGAKEAMRRQTLLAGIAKEIEKIFLREDLTMGELTEVMDLFNARAQAIFSRTKIKDIKKQYDGLN